MNTRSTKAPTRLTFLHALVSSSLLLSSSALADTLEPTAGAPTTGFFLSYDNGKINFMNGDKRTLHMSPSSVKRVKMDKPLKASLESKTKRGDKSDVMLTGFELGAFQIERDGKAEKIPVQMVSELRVDSVANMRTTDQLEPNNIISKGEETDLTTAVEPGKVTAIQFHLPGNITSEREGNYIATLERLSKGKLVVKRITVTDVNAPVAKQHLIKTLPQFWFYDKDAKFSSKLTDRFTESDIDGAIKKASK